MSDQKAVLQAGPWSQEGTQAIHPPSTPLPAGKFLRDTADASYVGQRDRHTVCSPGRLCPHSYYAMHEVPRALGDILLVLCIAVLDSWHSRERASLWRVFERLRASATAGQGVDQRQFWGLKGVFEASNRRVSSSIHPRYL